MTTATRLLSPRQTRRASAGVDAFSSGISNVSQTSPSGTVYDSRSGSPSVIKDSAGYQGVDSTHNLRLRFEIPQNVQMIQRVLLAFSLQAWRASQQSTAASNTSGSGGSQTPTSSGVSNLHSHGIAFADLVRGVSVSVDSAGLYASGSGGVTVGTNTDGPHTHTVSIAAHTHSIPSLSLNAPSGLVDQAMAQGCHVYITPPGGAQSDITTALGGPWGSGSALDVSDLDISAYVTSGGWWEIQISSTTLGGIIANVATIGIVGAL